MIPRLDRAPRSADPGETRLRVGQPRIEPDRGGELFAGAPSVTFALEDFGQTRVRHRDRGLRSARLVLEVEPEVCFAAVELVSGKCREPAVLVSGTGVTRPQSREAIHAREGGRPIVLVDRSRLDPVERLRAG